MLPKTLFHCYFFVRGGHLEHHKGEAVLRHDKCLEEIDIKSEVSFQYKGAKLNRYEGDLLLYALDVEVHVAFPGDMSSEVFKAFDDWVVIYVRRQYVAQAQRKDSTFLLVDDHVHLGAPFFDYF